MYSQWHTLLANLAHASKHIKTSVATCMYTYIGHVLTCMYVCMYINEGTEVTRYIEKKYPYDCFVVSSIQ